MGWGKEPGSPRLRRETLTLRSASRHIMETLVADRADERGGQGVALTAGGQDACVRSRGDKGGAGKLAPGSDSQHPAAERDTVCGD